MRLTRVEYPRLEIRFGGKNKQRDPEIIEVAEFIAVKSFRAKGKRLTSYQVKHIEELEPETKTVEPEEDLTETNTARENAAEKKQVKKPEETKADQNPDEEEDQAQMSLPL